MTREQAREAAQVMLAWDDGKEVQHRMKKCDSRSGLKPDWCDTDAPWWDFDSYEYRIKPTAKLRPWTADEVPLGAWLRYKGNQQSNRFLIVYIMERGIAAYNTHWPYQALLDEMEHSTDGGKTWKLCGVGGVSK